MKKFFSIVVCTFVLLCLNAAFAAETVNDSFEGVYISYSSASALKYKINSINRTIKLNEYKIKSIKSSNKLSQYEKNRNISKLESQNKYLKRQVYKLKNDYSRAIS